MIQWTNLHEIINTYLYLFISICLLHFYKIGQKRKLNSSIFIYLCTICFSKDITNSDDTALNDWITAEGVDTTGCCDFTQQTIQPVVEADRCDILKGTIQPFSQTDSNTDRNLSHVRQSSVQSTHLVHTSHYHLRQSELIQ